MKHLKKNPVFAKWDSRKIKSFIKFLGDKNTRQLVDHNSSVSGEQVDRLWGAFQNTKREELDKMIQRYIDSENGITDASDEDFLGYDELIKYLENKSGFKKGR